jgi:DNA-binding transcriptional MerR regulator/methylmalonyl-CoA mutase cobalamin-binding subunit
MEVKMEAEGTHPIKVVARRTGLSPHVIRVWEKRYNAVSPTRTETNRRRYSDADIARFSLLQRLIAAGRSIGQIAQLSTEQLHTLLQEDEGSTHTTALPPRVAQKVAVAENGAIAQTHFETCLSVLEQLDSARLEEELFRATRALGRIALIDQVIVPLMQKVGKRWREGSLRIIHEHLASSVIRMTLEGMRNSANIPPAAPHLIVTTPAGQTHELGALIVAAASVTEGWRVTYPGPNLPAEEIAAAVETLDAQAVALSIVYPPDDPHIAAELHLLRRSLPAEVTILAGGRAVSNYHEVLMAIGAHILSDITSLRTALETLRAT